MENHNFFMGKSTINGPCSVAMLVYQRINHVIILQIQKICVGFRFPARPGAEIRALLRPQVALKTQPRKNKPAMMGWNYEIFCR